MMKTQRIVLKKKVYFEDMANNWLLYKKISVKTSTYYNYNYLVNKYLNSRFKRYSIDDFENYNINEMISELIENLSAKTVKAIISIFISILKYSEGKYDYRFNLEPIAMPKAKIYELKVFSVREQLKIERYCINNYNKKYLGIVLSLYTGLRIGEICALTWKDIDLKNRTIYVRRTLQRIYISKNKTKILIDSPKSSHSIRKIPMCDKVYELLKDEKNEKEENDFFLTGDGRYIEPRRYQYAFNNMLKELKIKENNFHVLRHTFATNCIKVGMDAKSLSEILGHSTVNMTLNKYVHSSDKIKKKFLQKL